MTRNKFHQSIYYIFSYHFNFPHSREKLHRETEYKCNNLVNNLELYFGITEIFYFCVNSNSYRGYQWQEIPEREYQKEVRVLYDKPFVDPVISSLMTYLISEKNYNHGTEYKCNDLKLYCGITKNIHFVLTEITVGIPIAKNIGKRWKFYMTSPWLTWFCLAQLIPTLLRMVLMIVFENLRLTWYWWLCLKIFALHDFD